MAEAELTQINLSLDTPELFQFESITLHRGFDIVMKTIDRIFEMNRLKANIRLKLNYIVMMGSNDGELLPFVELT